MAPPLVRCRGGTGLRGDQYTQFLLALLDDSSTGSEPRWTSFCKASPAWPGLASLTSVGSELEACPGSLQQPAPVLLPALLLLVLPPRPSLLLVLCWRHLLLQVGSGFNDEELDRLNNHLQPLMVDSPPPCYK